MKQFKCKRIKIFIIILFSLVMLISTLFVLFARLFYSSYSYGHIAYKNEAAIKTAYFLSSALCTLDLPSDKEITLRGEYQGRQQCQLIIYSNEYISSDMVVTEFPKDEYEGYWIAKVRNSIVLELWYNDIEISDSQLKEYSINEQEKLTSFVNPFLHPILFHNEGFINDSLALGYYKANEDCTPHGESITTNDK